MNALFVFLGGGTGSVLRYLMGMWIGSAAFPWATLVVNAVGSFAIGLLGGWASRFGWGETLRLSLTVGLCGGFTTFSTFSKESLAPIESGRYGLFVLYVAGGIVLGISSAAFGFWMVK